MPFLIVSLLLTRWISAQPLGAGNARQPSEYEVKAAFLLNFTKFIEWPSGADAANGHFNICILGQDPFGETLDQIVTGEKVEGHPIAVRRISALSAATCEILFISKSERDVGKVLAETAGGTLTIGETEGFLRQGGMIALVVDDRRVRFDVNTAAAARGGLRISSRLLNVARSVENQARP
jgi:hypothetical protein